LRPSVEPWTRYAFTIHHEQGELEQYIEGQSNWPPQIETLIMASGELSQHFGDSVLLQRIPGHIGLPGNVREDHLAREGGLSTPTSEEPGNMPCFFEKARIVIRKWETNKWSESWDK
jgi:hypothetical protein